MKKKIAILGSTGSIGTTLLEIIKKDFKSFEITLLTANKNYNLLFKQAKIFKVKNLIITDEKSYLTALKLRTKLKLKIKIFNNFDIFKNIFKKKIDFVMSSIIGIDGLIPTFSIIKHTSKIVIANKESIVCGWNLIKKELIKNNTDFIPVDSEHFSIWFGIKDYNIRDIDEIYLTASGGPLLNYPIKRIDDLKISKILKHPTWKMGKKISIDSSTMMNKVFEVIEARNIFSIDLKKIKILIHTQSYLHTVIKFNNGMIKIIAHDTTMKIPIFNSLYSKKYDFINSSNFNIKKMNNLSLHYVDKKKFPVIKILKKIKNKITLYETLIVSTNDALVNLYLNKEIRFTEISNLLIKIISSKKFKKYKTIEPKNIQQILDLNKYVRLNIKSLCV